MTHTGSLYANAMAERVNSTLKTELTHNDKTFAGTVWLSQSFTRQWMLITNPDDHI